MVECPLFRRRKISALEAMAVMTRAVLSDLRVPPRSAPRGDFVRALGIGKGDAVLRGGGLVVERGSCW